MMLRYMCVLLTVMLFNCLTAQDKIYSNDKFELYNDRVVENNYLAKVYSPKKITSNYTPAFEAGFSREIRFKFCINGEDNETPSGNDHSFFLNPTNGKQTTKVYKFGNIEKSESEKSTGEITPINYGDTIVVTLRVDMSEMFNSFEKQGYYITPAGSKILKEQFKFVSVSGGTPPFDWNFSGANTKDNIILKDEDEDNIYTLDVVFVKETSRKFINDEFIWEPGTDISMYPAYSGNIPIVEALYNLSLEELIYDVREDSTFMAGAKWNGVWTRDISYSIILSLAAINPEISKRSLLAKVKNGMIIQDTGTGGSWPVSTDRIVWALAAWEIYKVTGDKEWLSEAYSIIKKTVETDIYNVFNKNTGLVKGESSFLDWREQTYPLWMDPKDIYDSENLGTNVVHYEAYKILIEMGNLLNEDTDKYSKIAGNIKQGINEYLYNEESNLYYQFLYGRTYPTVSKRSEALGAALAVLYDVPEDAESNIISALPVTGYGVPCIYPQISNIPNYHNNGIWPFVVGYYTWAAAKENNTAGVEHGLASIYRASLLYLTNKENFVAENGNCLGTEINSDRQLWSVGGNLATVYRIIFGINYEHNGITFQPFIPEAYKGTHKVTKFPYRDMTLEISVTGYGNEVSEFYLDGEKQESTFLPAELKGNHTIEIVMNNSVPQSKINYVENKFAPETPVVKYNDGKINWVAVKKAKEYHVYKNGELLKSTEENSFEVTTESKLVEYQVLAVDDEGLESFLSEPLVINGDNISANFKPEISNKFITTTPTENAYITFEVEVNHSGSYGIDFKYANGNGPINTDNKCAIRTLYVDDVRVGSVVLPQRGTTLWDSWGYSNILQYKLAEGKHTLKLVYEDYNQNMNIKNNKALIELVRLVPVK